MTLLEDSAALSQFVNYAIASLCTVRIFVKSSENMTKFNLLKRGVNSQSYIPNKIKKND